MGTEVKKKGFWHDYGVFLVVWFMLTCVWLTCARTVVWFFEHFNTYQIADFLLKAPLVVLVIGLAWVSVRKIRRDE